MNTSANRLLRAFYFSHPYRYDITSVPHFILLILPLILSVCFDNFALLIMFRRMKKSERDMRFFCKHRDSLLSVLFVMDFSGGFVNHSRCTHFG